MRLIIDEISLNKGIDTELDATHASSSGDNWNEHHKIARQRKIDSKDAVRIDKTAAAKVIALNLNPKHFLWVDGDTYRHLVFERAESSIEVVNYSKEQWYREYETILATGEIFHPAYKNLCNVLFNAKENPITLNAKTASTRYIENIVVSKMSKTDMTFDFGVANCCVKNGVFEHTADAHFTIITSEIEYPTLKKNGVLTTSAEDLIELVELLENQFYYKKGYSQQKDYMPVYRLLEPVINRWVVFRGMRKWEDKIGERLRFQLKSLREGPVFDDLPFSEIELLKLYNDFRFYGVGQETDAATIRDSISKSISIGDSKQAVNNCFYGFVYPKSIKKLLLKAGLFRFGEQTYIRIDEAIRLRGVDRTRDFITKGGRGDELDLQVLEDRYLLRAFCYGWSVAEYRRLQSIVKKTTEVKAALGKKQSLIRDTVNMYNYIKKQNPDFDLSSRNIKEIHDYLSPIHALYIRSERSAEMEAIKTVSTANQLKSLVVDGFVLRSPYTAYELISIGEKMRHCVASYAQSFYYRSIEIAVLTDIYDEYLVCLEIKDNYVVQAKMRFNAPVRDNLEYLEIVMQFMALNNLAVATFDIGDANEDGWFGASYKSQPRDESRIALVKQLESAEVQKAQALI